MHSPAPITLTRLDPTAEREALVAVLTGNEFPFHMSPRPTREQVEGWLAEGAFRDEDNDSFWVDHADLGRVGFFRLEDLTEGAPLFDLRLAEEFRGRGLAAEVLRAATELVFTTMPEVNRFEGQTREDNVAMRRTFLRCGFLKEAHYREGWPVEGGEPVASVAYAILRRDWESGTTTPFVWEDLAEPGQGEPAKGEPGQDEAARGEPGQDAPAKDDAAEDDEPVQGDEAAVLVDMLDRHRAALRRKCEGLTREQLNQTLPPSTMTLAGLLKHMAVVDSSYFSEDLLDEPLIAPFDSVDWEADVDWEWHSAAEDSPESLLALYDASVAESRRITAELLAGPDGLETLARRDTYLGVPARLRWIMAHMIEEYAQHNGHADLLREAVDGRTGIW